ncbi:MAG: cyclic nucleotide-binding domain-containing protein [Rhodospirillales bacterium]
MYQRRLRAGDFLWRTGEPAEAVFRLRAGTVRIGADTVEGGPGDGRLIGGIDVFAGAARPTSAAAVGDVVVDVISRAELLDAIGRAEDLAAPFMAAVVRRIGAAQAAAEAAAAAAEPATAAAQPAIRLRPAGKRLSGQIGEHDIVPDRLPFRIGRLGADNAKDFADVNLLLRDSKPYSLSRRHFEIAADGAQAIVRDCGSYHGTIVNGKLIGAGTGLRSAALETGVNDVIAGPRDSPFRFAVVVDAAV